MPAFDFRKRLAAVTFQAGDGEDLLIGSRFGDDLAGGAGDDALLGRNGGDTLRGGAGADLTVGGKGDDIFVFAAGDLVASRLGTLDSVVSFRGAGTSGTGQQDLLRFEGFTAGTTLRFAGYADDASPTLQYYEVVDAARPEVSGFILVSVAGSTTRQLTAADVVFVPRVNTAPTEILLSNAAIVENAAAGTAVGVLSATDPDAGDAPNFTLLDDAGGAFTLASDGVTLVATRPFDFESGPASYAVTVRATDRDGATRDEMLAVAVTNVDEAIDARRDVYTATEDTALAVDAAAGVLANDAAGDGGLTVVAGTFGTTAGGTVVLAADGSFTYTPPANVNGDDAFSYVARDADGDETTGTAVIVLTAANDAPTGVALSGASVAENRAAGEIVGVLSAADIDAGDAATFALLDDAGGAFALAADGVTLVTTRSLDFEGGPTAYAVTVRATDRAGATFDTVVDVAVTNEDEGVVAQDDSYDTSEDLALGVAAAAGLLVNDDAPDGGRSAVAGIFDTALGGSVVIEANGSFTYIPAADANGADSFTYTLRDADGDEATATARIAVAAVADAPAFAADGFTFAVTENNASGAAIGTAAAADPDGAPAAYTIVENTDADATNDVPFAIGADGRITAASPLDYETAARYRFIVRAADLDGLADTAAVTVDVGDLPERGLDFVTTNYSGANFSVRLGDGQGGTTGGGETGVGIFPTAVQLGDLDGDGDLDLIAANQRSNTVSVRLGDGAGGFGGGRDFGVGDGPTSLALGDLNRDGDLDFVVANGSDRTIGAWLGDGRGGFTNAGAVGVGDFPEEVALGDFDGDGDLDVASASFYDNTVSIRLGDGQGGFTDGGEVVVGFEPRGLALGDFDSDGDVDLVTANAQNDSVSVRLNDGRGDFNAGSEVGVRDFPVSVAVGDLDGDGDLDLAVANITSRDVSVRLGDGRGGFAGGSVVPMGAGPVAIRLGDLDGDGDLDIATANPFGDSVSVRLNNGSAGFGGGGVFAVGRNPQSLALGELDGPADLTPGGLPDLGTLIPVPADIWA